jgi:hypothetical protein
MNTLVSLPTASPEQLEVERVFIKGFLCEIQCKAWQMLTYAVGVNGLKMAGVRVMLLIADYRRLGIRC